MKVLSTSRPWQDRKWRNVWRNMQIWRRMCYRTYCAIRRFYNYVVVCTLTSSNHDPNALTPQTTRDMHHHLHVTHEPDAQIFTEIWTSSASCGKLCALPVKCEFICATYGHTPRRSVGSDFNSVTVTLWLGSHVSHFLGRARGGIVFAVGKTQVYWPHTHLSPSSLRWRLFTWSPQIPPAPQRHRLANASSHYLSGSWVIRTSVFTQTC
jgi:hypothetical protein